MTGLRLPSEFDLPPGRLEAQRRLLAEGPVPRRSRRVRIAVALAVLLAAALVVAPAFGLGSQLLDLLRNTPSPEQAEKETSVAADVHLQTEYEGESLAVLTYLASDGRLCFASRLGGGTGFGCEPRAWYFRDGPVHVSGPTFMQRPEAPGFDPTTWDRMWFAGLVLPEIARLEVVMTDCSRRPVPLDESGVFLFPVPRDDIHAGVWPHQLVSYDRRGAAVDARAIRTHVPETPQAAAEGTTAPRPERACR
jgi:hypothetical protein